MEYRLDETGFTYIASGENLFSANAYDADLAVDGWYDSPTHRFNLLQEDFSLIGLAIYSDDDGYYYYCQLFAQV
jgi:uncharacterized protein YkwD